MTASWTSRDEASTNAYEESANMGADGLRQRIIDDLSSFGEVVSLLGNIDNTQRHGIVLQDVVATVHHLWIRTPMHIDVRWDAAERAPCYFNELGAPIHFDENYDDDLVLTDEDERILDTVLKRLTSHPAWSSVNPSKTTEGSLRRPAALIGGGVGALAPIGANLAFWDPAVGVAVMASAGLAGVLGAAADRIATQSLRSRLRSINTAVKTWNRDPSAAFEALFANAQERTAFLDALMSACAAVDIDYQGDLQAISPWFRSVRQNWSYHDTTDKLKNDAGDLLAPLTGAMIRFRGASLPNYEPGEMLFDGRRFFFCAQKKNTYLICPIG